ncbi:type II secretion system secretin GspD [Oleiagrimonas soli]|uniref:General secretion pathway protein D n=1 Tax=Oleiagrimonas soli TaxID=1543381 RepID=A0A841KHC4_9GAMM|nr:type II secretion system secretin GspD [Oleiagrimonas soli]MBB6184576.1 general secretion pathway protein D [Oleiagrimonas soli]
MHKPTALLLLALTALLAGCSTLPQPSDNASLQREAMAGVDQPPPPPPTRPLRGENPPVAPPNSEIAKGTGVFVRNLPGANGKAKEAEGKVVFNFENQPIQAVVKAVLGDLLKRNYAIAPGVKGSITFSTSQPVGRDQALPILETLLSWTDNALVEKNGSYLVLPAKDAVAGNVSPSLGAVAPSGGMQARLFPLHYIGAEQMQKLLKPFARDKAFLLVDPARNLLVMGGTPQELANYQRTIRTFDVDWLKGMSVGVFGLQRANVAQLMPQLDKLFGPKSDSPLAGMLRFIPIERTNSIVVITPQPAYLSEVRDWIDRIDRGGGNQPQLYVYDVKNVQATYLADYLNQIYNGTSGNSGSDTGGSVGPGLSSGTIGGFAGTGGSDGKSGLSSSGRGSMDSSSSGLGNSSGLSDSSNGGGSGMSASGLPARQQAQATAGTLSQADKGGIGITAVDANNQLLVRCRPSQWAEIEGAIQRLDIVPLQVQIETRILEVQLTGEFSFGVQWYLEGLINNSVDSNGNVVPGQPGNQQQWALGGGGASYVPGTDNFFYSFVNSNLQAAVHAMETSGNTKVLSAPSLVVMNNQEAKIQVGTQVPVNQTYFTGGIGVASNNDLSSVGQVSYKDTGVILQVRPRVNPGGLVYLTLDQVVSKPGVADKFGNFPIDKRELNTQIAVQSGQTVLLGGLIQQDEGSSDTGVPGLSRIPIIGRLFGTTTRQRKRTELIVLITPKVIASSDDARSITQEYQSQFESLAPIRALKEEKRKNGVTDEGSKSKN